MFWRLQGDGELLLEKTETYSAGYCYAYLRCGRVPGTQTVILEADTLRWEQPFTNTPLNVNLVAGQIQTELNGGGGETHRASGDAGP